MSRKLEPLNAREYLTHLQEIIDRLPMGSVRDQKQAVHDRLCAKIDALPHRVAVALEGITDREAALAIITDEVHRVVSELPEGKRVASHPEEGMPTIYEVARRLNLDAKQFEQLVSEGRLDGVKLDEACLQRVRQLFGHRCQLPPKRKGGRHG